MHSKVVLILAALILAGFAHAENAPPPPYELHEWGVFAVPRNAAWANLDMKGEWAGMPKAFYGMLPERGLPYHGPVLKPVIYFHAEKPLKIDLTVTFAEGTPTIWWPAASDPVNTGRREGLPAPKSLTFQPWLVERPEQNSPAGKVPRELAVDEGHWVNLLRKVKASDVFCGGGHSHVGQAWDKEKFIYYDGLMKLPVSPGVVRDGKTVVLEVPGAEVWQDVMLVERDGEKLSVSSRWGGWTEALGPTDVRHERFEMRETNAEGLAALAKELTARLTQAGLNPDEAESMTAVWNEGLFRQDGLTLFYRIPQAVYDRWLPLKAKPAPAKTVRVGLVVHRHLEPELEARVAGLIKRLSSEQFDERDAALQALLKLGGAAFPQIDKASASDDPEVARQCKSILNLLDARPFLGKKE
ncbi:MAG: hypothetical protein KIS92_19295 [Planctomycetota bacterium]|nr:hypothetical protein [Planctomycetota bacterium]